MRVPVCKADVRMWRDCLITVRSRQGIGHASGAASNLAKLAARHGGEERLIDAMHSRDLMI